MIYAKEVKKTAIKIEQCELGKNLSQLVKQFRNGEIKEDIPTLVFLVKEASTHDTYYRVSFSKQLSTDGKEPNYYDIFLSSCVVDYCDTNHRLIEIEDNHEANYSFADELYTQLEGKPCCTMRDFLLNGYTDFYSNGFCAADYTKNKEYLGLLDVAK